MLSTARLNELANVAVFPARSIPDAALRTDLHLHTTFTDGRSELLTMTLAAAARGLQVIAFTEHVRRGIAWFRAFERECARAAATYPGRLLVGIEAKALGFDGAIDSDAPLVMRSEVVLGAVHSYPDGRGGFIPARELSAAQAADIELDAACALLMNPQVDVLAHPGAATRRAFGSFPESHVRVLVQLAARAGKAIELNAEYTTARELDELIVLCREANAWVSLGSNAHHASEVGRIGRAIGGCLADAA